MAQFNKKKFLQQMEGSLDKLAGDVNKAVEESVEEALGKLCQQSPVWSGSYVASMRVQQDNNPVAPPTNLKEDAPEVVETPFGTTETYGWPGRLEDLQGPQAVLSLRDETEAQEKRHIKANVRHGRRLGIINQSEHAQDVEVRRPSQTTQDSTVSRGMDFPFAETELELRFWLQEKVTKHLKGKRYV